MIVRQVGSKDTVEKVAAEWLADLDRLVSNGTFPAQWASHFRDKPQLADWQHLELLQEVAYFDGEAQETLDIVRQEMGIDDEGYPLQDVHGYSVGSRKSVEADRAFKESGL